ncbi:MAG: MFS transporter [Candidatus Thorarchaeota archaeon]|nr:MFS transporter [Candidatus Thorarchaeota archaeon]
MTMRLLVMPLFVLAINSDEAFYGLLMATAGYVQALFLLPGGTLSDKKGRGPAMAIGGAISGAAFFMLPHVETPITVLTVFALTGVGDGLMMNAVDALIADHTQKGAERTKSYGVAIGVATFAATIGPFVGGAILDENTLPFLGSPLARFALLFYIMGTFRLLSGIGGLYTERWLRAKSFGRHGLANRPDSPHDDSPNTTRSDDARTAFLFGVGQLLMGISSGMVIPYLIPWIYAAFRPEELVLGGLSSAANITLASGTLIVGMVSERAGKLKTVFILYLLVPLLTVGIVTSEVFLVMAVFYVVREALANMTRPATNSLFMEQVNVARRGTSWAVTRIMWHFPRQTGTLITSVLLGTGVFGGIVDFGTIVFPIAMVLYPLSVIPMYVAVRLNSRTLQTAAACVGPQQEQGSLL